MQQSERLKVLALTIDQQSKHDTFPTTTQLLTRHAAMYPPTASIKARKKSIERDLLRLLEHARIERVSDKQPYRYRACDKAEASDAHTRAYALQVMQTVVRDALPQRSFESLWPALLNEDIGLPLGDRKLRIVSDTLRLIPAEIKPPALEQVLEGLIEEKPVRLIYQGAQGKRSEPLVHPQGLLQRGPRLYLYAVKDDDRDTLRMYAMHRMIQAACVEVPFFAAPGFSLQDRINRGQADFASGERIELRIRARGYVADLLCDSPLAEGQVIEDEAEGSAFEIRVCATLPSTGQLLRWLLGCGDNIEVVAPAALRDTVRQQSMKMAGIYASETEAAT